ncbi:MAG: serine/threonine-protein phosphatase [Pseudomonas sp.]|uniref:PP2C family protein-serine/threonine phosphatase n=1 Tax=unclassified Pseudomonas TaxID=196821 RepID=UPI0015A4D817|nr:PP2C family serine/threonine-protein phosphatase [Pseudomonas sp.]MDP9058678.1 serine/threonine-protein phosphatase [Pseudomonadota bacterium]NVZ95831.1 serine/threonine-protein phosphatase [Pseudomonas sp. B6001]NWB14547.1 serine/threonine-protein phosphatase [Pseudomonas sp. D6002]NWD00528.1 serine/threonine-protein phosphatase [Pseudomonas sp. P7779]MDE1910834.1 serine/threonine-protein phosphatase [Pseudomonas sp.]
MSQPRDRWHSAGRTDRGKVRLRNEDAFLDCPGTGCWAVADGMGGHQAGDIASQLVVDGLASLPGQGSLDERVEATRRCLQWLNRRLGDELTLASHGAEAIMGSTVVALLLQGDRAACVWAGDSRCYLWRGQTLYQLSRDHSLCEQLIDQQVSPEQARAHPDARALTRAIGSRAPLSPQVLELGTLAGDVFLLCSDGLYQALSHSELGQALSQGNPQRVLDQLFAGVLRGTAGDNLTAVVVQSCVT